MKVYETTETTSLLNYERRSNERNKCLTIGFMTVASTVIIVAAVFIFHIFPQAASITFLGSMRNVPPSLNSVPTSHKVPSGCESTVMIIRHCEKEGPLIKDKNADEHCSYLGFQRARFLTTLFGHRWPIPSVLYALSPERHHGYSYNYREVETLGPLSELTGITVKADYSAKQTRHLAEEIFHSLRSGHMCGKVTVICWKHSKIPALARSLGWTTGVPRKYPSWSFDEVWQIKYVYQPPALYSSAAPSTMADAATTESTTSNHKKKHGKHSRQGAKDVAPRNLMSESWVVYGSTQQQNFDPLSYSHVTGNYPGANATSNPPTEDDL